jgi:hypothetical protein
MVRCPGCGGRNPRDSLSCEWCRRPFVALRRRGLSARWWGVLSGAVIAALLLMVGALALLNATRPTGRTTAAAPTAAPTLLPLPITSPSPLVASSPTAVAAPPPSPTRPPPSPTATPAPRYARITNTGGLGANLRREPSSSSPPVAALAENAVVRLLGPEERGTDGRLWRQVEDNRGNQGWVPADFMVDAPGPG